MAKRQAYTAEAASVSNLPTNLGSPARAALANLGYVELEQLNGVSEKQLLATHGVGPKAVTRLKEALAAAGLALSE